MTTLSKSETVEVRGIVEAVEYIQTALKQGYKEIKLEKGAMNTYTITISQ